METTITNLLKSLAEALSPFLPSAGAADETTVSDAVSEAIEEAVENIDYSEKVEEYMACHFDPSSYDILTEGSFDPSDYDIMTDYEVGLSIESAIEDIDIEERVTSCVEERIEEAVKAALDAANVVTTSTLLAYINAISMVVKGGDESSTFIAEGSEV
jgi:hypothetical protein